MKSLEELHQKYKGMGLRVLGFPCNQFGKQEPGEDKEILEWYQQNYNTTFDLFQKCNVAPQSNVKPGISTGDPVVECHPLWNYLQNYKKDQDGTAAIKWNFTKFLVDRSGNVVFRSQFRDDPVSFEKDIVQLLVPQDVYSFQVTSITGEERVMSEFKDEVLLIVNVARE